MLSEFVWDSGVGSLCHLHAADLTKAPSLFVKKAPGCHKTLLKPTNRGTQVQQLESECEI
jgi:hypothetical protein